MLEKIFRATIEEYNLVKKKDRIILGVSGGPDSVCMLYQFQAIAKDYKLHLVCVHLNHGLRPEADEEERYIHSLCRKLTIPCVSEKRKVKTLYAGDSLEQTARKVRFDFFLACARRYKSKTLALAHHKDDLAETVLMRLIRGSGLRGLRGFLPRSRYKSLTVIRPMINVTKNDILAWLKDHGVSYCTDASNTDDVFLRNRIRMQVLPLLRELNPNIVDTLYNASQAIAADYEFISLVAREAFLGLRKREAGQRLYLDLEGVKKLSQPLFNNVIRTAIEELQGHTRRLEVRHLKEVYDLVHARRQTSIVDLPDLLVKKDEKTLIIQSLLL